MSITNFPNGISSMWVPVLWGGLPATSGKYIFVDYTLGSDGNNGEDTSAPVKTVAQANSLARTNKDDVIVLMGNATHVLSSMLDLTKNRVHFVWMDATWGRLYGQNAKVSLTATTWATNIATIKNTWVRNSFSNIKFMNESTVTEWIYCIAWGWEYALFTNCEFYKSTDLDETTAAEYLCNDDSAQFINCTFGSLANIVADNVIRPCVSLTATISWKKARDVYFENCLFFRKAAWTESVMVYWTNATDVERLLLMKNCTFISNALWAATPAHAVWFWAAQTQWTVLLQDCTSVDCTVMAQASVGIYVSWAVPTFATTWVAKAS